VASCLWPAVNSIQLIINFTYKSYQFVNNNVDSIICMYPLPAVTEFYILCCIWYILKWLWKYGNYHISTEPPAGLLVSTSGVHDNGVVLKTMPNLFHFFFAFPVSSFDVIQHLFSKTASIALLFLFIWHRKFQHNTAYSITAELDAANHSTCPQSHAISSQSHFTASCSYLQFLCWLPADYT